MTTDSCLPGPIEALTSVNIGSLAGSYPLDALPKLSDVRATGEQ
jgi:lipase chaperone LimK